MDTYSDNEFIEGFKQSDQRMLNAFYKLHFASIQQLVILNGGDSQEAKDVYQEGIIVLYEKILDNKLVLTSSLKTYLYSICRNLWLKQLQRKSKFTSSIADNEAYHPIADEDVLLIEEEMKQFDGMKLAMENIGEPCYSLINDFYFNQLSMADLTLKYNYTNADNTKNQKYKCMNRLKKIFFELYIPPVK